MSEPVNGKPQPKGNRPGSQSDQPGGKIFGKGSSRQIRLVGPPPFTIEAKGFEYLSVSEKLMATPLGMAVVPVNDHTELVVLVSARRKAAE